MASDRGPALYHAADDRRGVVACLLSQNISAGLGIGSCLRGDAFPFAFVELRRCLDGDCLEFESVNARSTDREGRFLFSSDSAGFPLTADRYQVAAFAETQSPAD